jgi:hypothetical protein
LGGAYAFEISDCRGGIVDIADAKDTYYFTIQVFSALDPDILHLGQQQYLVRRCASQGALQGWCPQEEAMVRIITEGF